MRAKGTSATGEEKKKGTRMKNYAYIGILTNSYEAVLLPSYAYWSLSLSLVDSSKCPPSAYPRLHKKHAQIPSKSRGLPMLQVEPLAEESHAVSFENHSL